MSKGTALHSGVSFFGFMAAVFVVLVLSFPAAQAETVCAEVKIEIKQELTLERQAFDANMKINNDLDLLSLKDVTVDVSFMDADGKAVLATSDPNNTSALFYIRVDSMEGVDSVAGGTIKPKTKADVHWLIIPSPGASVDNPLGTLYFVGAKLSYTVGGEKEEVEVTPDFIRVKPLPEITLDYFLTRFVNADDPSTLKIEPTEPFTLGVRVQNNGTGLAEDLKIKSAQPKIVENDQGLLIDFVITGSTLNDSPREPTLLIDFGDIASGKSSIGRWVMETTLAGEFTEFSASFTHSDSLGGAVTSILEAVNTHFLVHDVRVDLPGRDLVRDFLADDAGVLKVYESNNVDSVVTDLSSESSLAYNNSSNGDQIYTLKAAETTGFMYVKLADSASGEKVIKEVIRSDGKRLPAENAWFSKERAGRGKFDYYFHLFDANSTGSYTVVMGDKSEVPLPPVIQFVPDRTTHEGKQIGFLVEASDPNGTIPTFSSPDLPKGATLKAQDNGSAVFDWTPAIGQAGVYEVTFTASDGELSASRKAFITVNPANDTDGDGMDDAWELDHFGTLDRDGSGDFDGDGISDLDEFLNKTDPSVPAFFNFKIGTASAGSDAVVTELSGFKRPVVFAGAPTVNELEPALARIDQVSESGFRLRLQEWQYADGEHELEGVPYLVMEPGRHIMPDGSIWEVGTLELVSEQRWQSFPFVQAFAETPQVYLSLQTMNDKQPVVVRAKNVTKAGFDAALFEEERNADHGRELVGYLAIYKSQRSSSIKLDTVEYQIDSGIETLTDKGLLLDDGITTVLLQEEASKDEELTHEAESVALLRINDSLFVTDNSTVESDTIVFRRKLDTATVATPVINPKGGTVSEAFTVTLSTITEGANLYYTLDGSTPDPVDNADATQTYTAAFTIDKTTTLKVIGKLDGYADSLVASETYTLVENTAPKFIEIPDRSVVEEKTLSFKVQALDQNTAKQASLSVDLSALPGSPSFVDNGDGTGVFSWKAPLGAAAKSPFTLKFVATDAQDDSLTASESMKLSVVSAAEVDSDSDGMPDVWEKRYSLDPDDATDATGDSDRDGFNNLEEYQNGTNPLVVDSAVNESPVAKASANVVKGPIPLSVQFTGSSSSDSDGKIAAYAWNFGDETSSDEADPSHSFANVGVYTVKLTVTDDDGASSSTTVIITTYDPNDSDADGLNDRWEMLVIGSLDSDGSGDFDGDGVSDRDEYLLWAANGNNYDPLALNDSVATVEGSPVSVAVLGNDSDRDGDALSISAVTQGENGSVVMSSDGYTLSYQPAVGFIGSDSFGYTVSDGKSEVSAQVAVVVDEYAETPYQYYVLNPALAGNPIEIASLINGNSIIAGSTTLELDRNEVGQVAADDLVAGAVVTGSGPFEATAAVDGADMLTPSRFAATEFVVPLLRHDHRLYLLSPGVAANVEIAVAGNSTQISLDADTVSMHEVSGVNGSATVVTSDQPVLLLHTGIDSTSITDVYSVPPASLELWGGRSSQAVVAATENETTVYVYADDGLSEHFVLDAGEQQAISIGLSGSNGLGGAVHIVADKPIAAIQASDADDTVAFISASDFGKRFSLPLDTQYLSVVCTQEKTVVTVDDGVSPVTQTCEGSGIQPGKLVFGSEVAKLSFAAGSRVEASAPVWMYYQSYPGASEQNLLGTRWSNALVKVKSPGDQRSVEGDSVNLSIDASDADGQALTFTASGLPSGLAINESGVIKGTPALGSTGTYPVTISVSDGIEPVRIELTWQVSFFEQNDNSAPSGFPRISGTPLVGEILSADTSAISDEDGMLGFFSYQWLANGESILGANSSSYRLGVNETGKQISVLVTYVDGKGGMERVVSRSVGPVVGPARQYDPFGKQACFYTETDYSGREYCYPVGEYSFLDVEMGEAFKSMKLPSTLEVFAYAMPSFLGEAETYSEDMPTLDSLFNPVNSLKVIDLSARKFDPAVKEACFYTGSNYKGMEFCFPIGDYRVLSHEQMNVFSSLKVPQQVEVRAFSDPGYFGMQVNYLDDEPELDMLNDNIESLKLIDTSDNQSDSSSQDSCFFPMSWFQWGGDCNWFW